MAKFGAVTAMVAVVALFFTAAFVAAAFILRFLLAWLEDATRWDVALDFWPCLIIVVILWFVGLFLRRSK